MIRWPSSAPANHTNCMQSLISSAITLNVSEMIIAIRMLHERKLVWITALASGASFWFLVAGWWEPISLTSSSAGSTPGEQDQCLPSLREHPRELHQSSPHLRLAGQTNHAKTVGVQDCFGCSCMPPVADNRRSPRHCEDRALIVARILTHQSLLENLAPPAGYIHPPDYVRQDPR